MEQKEVEVEDTDEEKEDDDVLVQEKDDEEVCLNEDEEEMVVMEEKPAEGTITARNSSRSMAPSLSTSPSLEMAPSPSRSICLKALTAPSLPLKVWLTLKTTAAADGHITPMNSSRSISPSPLESPRAKIATTSCSLSPAEAISFLLMLPSPSLSSFLKPCLISSKFL